MATKRTSMVRTRSMQFILLFAPQYDNGVLLCHVHRTVGDDFDDEIDNVESDIELLLRLVAAQQDKQEVCRAVNGLCCKMLLAQIQEGLHLSRPGSIQCSRMHACTLAHVRLAFALHFHSTNQHDAELLHAAARVSSDSVLCALTI